MTWQQHRTFLSQTTSNHPSCHPSATCFNTGSGTFWIKALIFSLMATKATEASKVIQPIPALFNESSAIQKWSQWQSFVCHQAVTIESFSDLWDLWMTIIQLSSPNMQSIDPSEWTAASQTFNIISTIIAFCSDLRMRKSNSNLCSMLSGWKMCY